MRNIYGHGTEMIEGFGGGKPRGIDTKSIEGWHGEISTEHGIISDGFTGSYIEGCNG